VFVAAGATASAFVFVAGAPFVFAQHYALTPTQFSALMGLNAAGQIISTQFAPPLMRRLGAARLLHAVTLTVTAAGSCWRDPVWRRACVAGALPRGRCCVGLC
jgi:hypothetical protein